MNECGQRLWVVGLSFVVSACSLFGTEPDDVAKTCDPAGFVRSAASLPLPSAAATRPKPRKGVPLKVASSFPIGGGLNDIGAWVQTKPGWSSWRLRLVSENAQSMALHLKPFQLPADAELWLCTPSGEKQGPFTAKGPTGTAELWSPALNGPELWLELQAPDASKNQARLIVNEVFAAFR